MYLEDYIKDNPDEFPNNLAFFAEVRGKMFFIKKKNCSKHYRYVFAVSAHFLFNLDLFFILFIKWAYCIEKCDTSFES